MALKRAESIGASSCQIFVKNNMQWFGRAHTQKELAAYQAQLASSPLQCVFGHTGYLINIAGPASENLEKSIRSLVEEVALAQALGIPFLVLHPGGHLGQGEDQGLAQAAQSLNQVLKLTKTSTVRIALEVTAGQGTCLGHRLEHLAELYARSAKPERLAVCLDTAHLFAAGYDIRTPKGWNQVLETLDDAVGLDQVMAVHLNDSKTDLGSKVDRHAGIGQGKIGRKAFAHIVNEPRFARLPGCLETPKSDDLHEDVENLAILRSLCKPPRSRK